MQEIRLTKYPEEEIAISSLHHLDDALDTLAFLKAEDFVVEQLRIAHNKSAAQAKRIAKRISSHANIASQYAKLSLNSPPEVSFLPGYYCILNLAKCVSLSGPYSNEFDNHSRWHGATYNTQGKNSQTILTDEVRVRGGGALALFYKTVAGQGISSDKFLKLRDFYYLMPGIGSELSTITKEWVYPWFPKFYAERKGLKVVLQAVIESFEADGRVIRYGGSVRSLPCLKGFSKKTNEIGTFVRQVQYQNNLSLEQHLREYVKTEYLEFVSEDLPYSCHEQSSRLPLPTEFATALAFFHLSSVCRYNPESIEKLSKSKSWPMLLALRRQGLYFFIVSTYSYIIQKNYILKS